MSEMKGHISSMPITHHSQIHTRPHIVEMGRAKEVIHLATVTEKMKRQQLIFLADNIEKFLTPGRRNVHDDRPGS
jgi:hypothetical protein